MWTVPCISGFKIRRNAWQRCLAANYSTMSVCHVSAWFCKRCRHSRVDGVSICLEMRQTVGAVNEAAHRTSVLSTFIAKSSFVIGQLLMITSSWRHSLLMTATLKLSAVDWRMLQHSRTGRSSRAHCGSNVCANNEFDKCTIACRVSVTRVRQRRQLGNYSFGGDRP